MEEKKEKKRIRKSTLTTLALIALMLMTAFVGGAIFKLQYDSRTDIGEKDVRTYDRYYAFIAADEDSDYWKAVYEGAAKEGEKNGSFVEDFASDIALGYTPAERVEIAIASDVDGIIAEGNNSSAFKKAIKKASDAGIPVVLAGNDDANSGRISFVGVSRYDLGTVYGKQAVDLSKKLADKKDKIKITVLLSQNADVGVQNLLVGAIRETVLSDADLRGKISLSTYMVSDSGTFASQESVKDLFTRQEEDIPDIIIALNEEHTNSAYQALIDYNLVGDCDIIGYYKSDTIINAIENEVIYSTVTTDAKQMGNYCARAMDEYKDSGYVSEFYAVDIYVMDKETLARGEVSE